MEARFLDVNAEERLVIVVMSEVDAIHLHSMHGSLVSNGINVSYRLFGVLDDVHLDYSLVPREQRLRIQGRDNRSAVVVVDGGPV